MEGLHQLAHLQHQLTIDLGLTAVAACEIEFYLHGSFDNPAVPLWRETVLESCADAGIAIANIEAERGYEQHEISLRHTPDVLKAAQDCVELTRIVHECAAARGLTADFSAKPRPDQPGSGLHVHVHLADSNGHNLYSKRDSDISQALAHSLAGLLAWMPDCMPVFAPHVASYDRFTQAGPTVPTTVSWGANNRTVALRLPDKGPVGYKHIEHRVAGSDANPLHVMAVILAAIHDGMTRQLPLTMPQTYGDASLPMYKLPALPKDYVSALQQMQRSTLLPRYFTIEDFLAL